LNITDDKRYLLGAELPAHACGASDLPVLKFDARE